jgi:hypothetical protein
MHTRETNKGLPPLQSNGQPCKICHEIICPGDDARLPIDNSNQGFVHATCFLNSVANTGEVRFSYEALKTVLPILVNYRRPIGTNECLFGLLKYTKEAHAKKSPVNGKVGEDQYLAIMDSVKSACQAIGITF